MNSARWTPTSTRMCSLLLPCLLISCVASAQSRFGSVSYQVPAQWSVVATNDSLVVLEPDRLEPVEDLLLCLMLPVPAQGALTNDLERAYSDALANLTLQPVLDQGLLFRASAPIQTPGGRTIMFGEGTCTDGTTTYELKTYVAQDHDQCLRVFGLANILPASIAFPPTSALHNPRFAHQVPQFALQLSTGMPVDPPSRPIQSLAGLWRGLSMFGGVIKNAYAYFYPDGQVYFASRMPLDGFDNLMTDADAVLTPQYWGRYVFDGQQGEIRLPYSSEVFPFERISNHLTITTTGTPHEFSEQTSVDRDAFDGTYFLQLLSGEKPTLSLSLDGRFVDQGLLTYVDHWIYPFRVSDQPGEGTYTITNFTIVFQYLDGRVLRLPFSGLGLSAGDPSPVTLAIGSEDDFLTLSGEPRPRLIVVADNVNPGGLKIRWPTTATGYVLQATDSLASPVWRAAPETSVVEGTDNVVTIQSTGPSRFFRLVKQ